ncbi:hypothetical protein PVIIG_06004 [Plasmodium vivax India VII]|uniref:Variable surface protein Vir35 n=1 Tax=Plasmodium vivax India VII TaxID=1077284 RepID=A0A0J9SK83_PLAVI|nr:hypothetical protein PVIIG_06004 [Plasmodium vivax India VII]
MELLGYYSIKNNVNFVVLLKFFTYLLLIWNQNNDVGHLDKSLEKKYKSDISLDMNFNRLLAKHDVQRELKYSRQGANFSNVAMNKNTKNVLKDTSSYGQLSKKGKTGLDVYMNDYKRRYRKKKGLSKLDCYCEKKVFNKIHHLYEIAEKMQNDEKRLKKFFLKKYGLVFILFALLPALGLIFPILFGGKEKGKALINLCTKEEHLKGERSHVTSCASIYSSIDQTAFDNIGLSNYVIFSIIGAIVSIFFIYIVIKLIKYERLKSRKGKMSAKEYCSFCKDVFF